MAELYSIKVYQPERVGKDRKALHLTGYGNMRFAIS
jgi:hypothetical protein